MRRGATSTSVNRFGILFTNLFEELRTLLSSPAPGLAVRSLLCLVIGKPMMALQERRASCAVRHGAVWMISELRRSLH